jgi:DNA-directed RNA polymerase subunit alpha
MRIRWRGLELPTRVSVDKDSLTGSYGRFSIEPFVRGFGSTLGNSLRRVLLSSIEGTAVTAVKIQGVLHEFSSIPGVLEDVTDVILNLKNLRVRLFEDDSATFLLEAKKKGEIRAAMIDTRGRGEVVNSDMVVATLAEDGVFSAELEVRRGRGYVTSDEHTKESREIGVIPVDAIFSPVRRVRFHTEETRVGKLTNYDRLVLEIWTDGTTGPELALVEAAKILRKHLNPFVQYFELGPELPLLEIARPLPTRVPAEAPVEPEPLPSGAEGLSPELSDEMREKLGWSVERLDLGPRVKKLLDDAQVTTVRDLVSRREKDIMEIKNFGETALAEVKARLADHGLTLGMRVEAMSEATKGGEA